MHIIYLCALILCIFCQVSVRVCQVFENHRKISTKMHFICQKFYPRKSGTFAPINGKSEPEANFEHSFELYIYKLTNRCKFIFNNNRPCQKNLFYHYLLNCSILFSISPFQFDQAKITLLTKQYSICCLL